MAVPELGMTVTRAMLVTHVESRFPESDRARILTLLDALAIGDDPLSARVQLAIVKLSRGDPSEVPSLIAQARADYRDVLAAAEYRHEMAAGVSARAEAIAAARRKDLDEFRAWLGEIRSA